MKLVLASASPRRAALLDQMGLAHTTSPTDIDETRRPDEAPGEYVERLAREKATAAAATYEDVVVGADTAVVFEGHVMGKPAHPAEARSMLLRLQGQRHEVFTGIAVRRRDEVVSAVDVTHVDMLAMTEEEIRGYVESGEPMDKAGAYALQGTGGMYVRSVSGSPFTVVGLPIHLLARLLSRVGVGIDRFRKASSV